MDAIDTGENMKQSEKQRNVAFFENNGWYHRTKTLCPDGSVKYSKKGGFANARDAERSYRQHEAAFREDYRRFHLANSVDDNISLRDYLTYWFEEVYSERIESTTRMVGAYAVYNLLLPNMEYDIKTKYVNADYLNSVLDNAAKISPSAGNTARTILYIAMKDAVVEGFVKNNPVIFTKPYRRPKPKVLILGKDKLKVLLCAARETEWYLEILLGLFCGLRKGEIMGLKFSDFDLEEDTVTVNRQVGPEMKIARGSGYKIEKYELVEKEPKTSNSYRTIRMPGIISEELVRRKALIDFNRQRFGDGFRDGGYISCQPNGLLHSMTALNTALTKICSRNSLPHITVHGLRHMYATILIEQGVPLVKISALLGHSSIHTTFEYYCDMMDENENILAFMNNAFPVMEDD